MGFSVLQGASVLLDCHAFLIVRWTFALSHCLSPCITNNI